MRTIAVVTSTRAEYGLLRPVLQRLQDSPEICLQLVVTGTHLDARYGGTVCEIEKDGLPIAARLPILAENEEPVFETICRTIRVFSDYLTAHCPDVLLVLGDRYEIFAVATAATCLRIPIAHISGGDVTLGAADEYYRHCITKMACLHFPSCASSAARLVRMGEAPETVFCVGGLGDENIRTLPKLSREELCESTGFPLNRPFALVTYHPETGAMAGDPLTQAEALITAMRSFDDIFWLMTGSNADEGGRICTEAMRKFAADCPERAAFVQNLGLQRYLSAMQYASLVLGNSSSGVVETPTFRVPTVNVGNRQNGREICANVLCCPATLPAIRAAIRQARSPEFAVLAAAARSPYCGGSTSAKIVRTLTQYDFGKTKRFYDGPVPEFDPAADTGFAEKQD